MKKGDIARAVQEELERTEINPIRNAKMRLSADINGAFRVYTENILKKLNLNQITKEEAIQHLIILDGQMKNALADGHEIIDGYSGNPTLISGKKPSKYLMKQYASSDWVELNSEIYANIFFLPEKKRHKSDNDEKKRHKSDNDNKEIPYIDTKQSIIAEPKKELDVLFEELDTIVGLTKVKQAVKDQVNRLKLNKLREGKGLPPLEDLSLHMVFLGNPGTGKTTIARIVGQIYGALGLLSSGHLIVAQRADLVGEYIGHTAVKTNKLIEAALGGILFIDEAYSLAPEENGKDFGQEAIATLITAMENNRNDFMVIAAGYPKEMKRFLFSNPGLKSRFGMTINFDDYNGTELFEIFTGMIAKDHFILPEDAAETLKEYFNNRYKNRDNDSEPFSNGRLARNVRDKLVTISSTRIANSGKMNEMTPEELSLITGPDVEEAIRLLEAEKI